MIIKLAPSLLLRNIPGYHQADGILLAKQLLKSYDRIVVKTKLKGLEAAREAFDLTNNPRRQEELELRYGLHRSLSVGDVVEVSGINYYCDSVGWVEL